jgi:hypothetical protein
MTPVFMGGCCQVFWGGSGEFTVRREDGSRFARMPTHAIRLHEWGTQVLLVFHVCAVGRFWL